MKYIKIQKYKNIQINILIIIIIKIKLLMNYLKLY